MPIKTMLMDGVLTVNRSFKNAEDAVLCVENVQCRRSGWWEMGNGWETGSFGLGFPMGERVGECSRDRLGPLGGGVIGDRNYRKVDPGCRRPVLPKTNSAGNRRFLSKLYPRSLPICMVDHRL